MKTLIPDAVDDKYDNLYWFLAGSCRTHFNRALWFSDDRVDQREAKRICREECPIKDKCLEHAVKDVEVWGIWGGTSAAQRKKARRAVK